VVIQESADRVSCFATNKYAIAKQQGIPHKTGCSFVAPAAFLLESWRSIRLREEHTIDSVDLVVGRIVILQKLTEIVHMMPALQISVRHAQKLTGEITRMSVTGSAPVMPQPMQVPTSGSGYW
jgi:hypothetical protein